MNDLGYNSILALLLINKGEPLNNSYKLMNILEWWFRVLNTKEILDDIKQKKYAEYTEVDGMHFYAITQFGRELIRQEYSDALKFLMHNYPNRIDMLNDLFLSFDKSVSR